MTISANFNPTGLVPEVRNGKDRAQQRIILLVPTPVDRGRRTSSCAGRKSKKNVEKVSENWNLQILDKF